MNVKELRQYCKQRLGNEMRCCLAVKGATPLLYGFLGGVLIFDDEVRLEAFKPEHKDRDGSLGYYTRYTLTCKQLLERLSKAKARAQVTICYEDGHGRYCRAAVQEVLMLRSMCILYTPARRKFMQRMSAMKK